MELVKQNSINIGDLSANPNFRHPTLDDIGKPVFYENGRWVGHFNGLKNDHLGDARVTVTRNDNISGFTYNPNDTYVEINPRVGGKSRRRRTKKTRRGKSKRRGRKTRGQRR
jgi:hypothetical protein